MSFSTSSYLLLMEEYEPAEDDELDGLTSALATMIETRMLLAWRVIGQRLALALEKGDLSLLEPALSPELWAELRPRLLELPRCQLTEPRPQLQLLDIRLDEGSFVYTVREQERSELAALLLGDGLLEAEIAMKPDWLFHLTALRSADEPVVGARTVEVDVGVESLFPDDYSPPRYRVEPTLGEGLFFGIAERDEALELAAELSLDGADYQVYDRESLERRGSLIGHFSGGAPNA